MNRDVTAESSTHEGKERHSDDDDAAFAAYYDRWSGPVYSIAWRVLGDEAQAAEVTEDAFTRAWRMSAHRSEGARQPTSWLLRLTHSLALAVLARRSAPQAGQRRGLLAVEDGSTAGESIVDQSAVELAFWDGLSCREIASARRCAVADTLAALQAGMRLLAGEVESATVTLERPPVR